MITPPPNIALIVAAGRGRRAQSKGDGLLDEYTDDISQNSSLSLIGPKQYEPLAGLSVLGHTLRRFLTHSAIDKVCVVIHEDDAKLYEGCLEDLRTTITKPLCFSNLLPPAIGGRTRADSVRKGLGLLIDEGVGDDAVILVHDAARPLVPFKVIDRVIAASGPGHGAVAALPVSDTLKYGSKDAKISATHPREGLWYAQTPQGFTLSDLTRAYDKAKTENMLELLTDDASAAEAVGLQVNLVLGAIQNMKITYKEDFMVAENYLSQDTEFSWQTRIGQGVDVHSFELGDAVILCGIPIPHEKQLKGHSDADVAMHALTDALLGAISAGDIGDHFPPSDPQWRGSSSEVFLRHAATLITDLKGRIINCDITIICEEPKIGPHRQKMRENIARILALSPTCISVKATTTEGLGFTGRKEGISAIASASVALSMEVSPKNGR